MPLATPSVEVCRILSRLEAAEAAEPDPHLRDDLRIAWITVLNAWRGLEAPNVAATYAVLGLHPEKVWPALVERRRSVLGNSFNEFWGENLPPKKPAASSPGSSQKAA